MRSKYTLLAMPLVILLATRVDADVVFRINAGGPDYTDPDGQLWRSDSALGYFNIGESYSVASSVEIEGTDLDPIFRSHRYDSSLANPEMAYSFPVAPGYYSVSLYFADVYWGFEGRRRFGVEIEGDPVLVDYDIVGLTGGRNVADIQQFVTQVVDGDSTLDIRFTHGSIDHPLICGFLVESIPPAPIITSGEAATMSVSKNSTCSNTTNLLSIDAVDPDTNPALLQWTISMPPALGSVSFWGGNSTGPEVIMCYTPAPGQTQPDSFNVNVSDGDVGNVDEIHVNVMVRDTQAPDITCPATVTLDADAALTPDATGMATATDDFGAAPILNYNDTVVSGVCPVAIELQRTWTARDSAGNASTCVQRIRILDNDTDGDGTVDCADIAPDDADVGGTTDNTNLNNNGNANDNDSGGDNANDNGGENDDANSNTGDSNDNSNGGGLIIDPATGQPVPTQECCGGGFPAMIPFMLLGWRRRRSLTLKARR